MSSPQHAPPTEGAAAATQAIAVGSGAGAERVPLVYVLILNYDSLDDTLACVDCVRASDHPNLRVLVIDNASPDGSGRELARRLPASEFLQLDTNTGYAGGNNAGFELALRAGADHVFVLNPDVRVDPATISACVEVAESADDVGAVNPVQLEHDGRTIDGKFWRTVLRPTGQPGPAYGDRPLPDAVEARELLGAALFMSRRALEKVGGFDPLFFAYGEETDLCRRIQHHGLRLLVSGKAPIRHLRTKESTGVSDFVLFLRLKGLYLGILKDPRQPLRRGARELTRRILRDLAGFSQGVYPFNQYAVTRRHTLRAVAWVIRHFGQIRRHRQLALEGRAHV